MHSIRLNIEDSVFDKVIYFLENLPKNEVKIVSDSDFGSGKNSKDNLEVKMYSNSSANLVEDWKDDAEDEIWK